MGRIHNPVLRGFNPDPSILRVDDTYFIATSTFEWFPGVQIHSSTDLATWRLVTSVLDRPSQLDLRGIPDSGGIYAPCLSHCHGVFYLVYTITTSRAHAEGEIFEDYRNYLVTSGAITGPWSEPVYLNSSGFDPSLFHDDDGRKWLVNMVRDHRPGRNTFAGIALQEYSVSERRLTGPSNIIFCGTGLGYTEGPHLYKRGDYYYLLTAEGGTSHGHAVTMARSPRLEGPYEVDPENPLLTSRNNPSLELQKAGHASLVGTPQGEWYIAHLCSRPLAARGVCILGRETALQRVVWTHDLWLRLEHGSNEPAATVEVPGAAAPETPLADEYDDFDEASLRKVYQTLRTPFDRKISLADRPGWLTIFGQESLNSLHRQSIVARRQQAFVFTAETRLDFHPASFQQMAGLIHYYDTQNYYYLYVTRDEGHGRVIELLGSWNGQQRVLANSPVAVDDPVPLLLRLTVRNDRSQFWFSTGGGEWTPCGPQTDVSNLSDDCFESIGLLKFTGAFVGMCCQDLSGSRTAAHFDYFRYVEEEPSAGRLERQSGRRDADDGGEVS